MHLQIRTKQFDQSIPNCVVGMLELPLDELYQTWFSQGFLLLDRHARGLDVGIDSVNNFMRLHRVLVANGILGGFR
jgi:hypothetical protein